VSDKLRQLQTQLATNEATEMLFVQQQATLSRRRRRPPSTLKPLP
jgi:hypothetical protein